MNKLKLLIKNNYEAIIKPVVVLLAICIIIPLALAATNLVTESRIAALEEQEKQSAMELLFKGAEFEAHTENDMEYYSAHDNNELIGYIFTTHANGYGGEVSVMTAVNADGTVKAVKILDVSNETPGLGQNASKESFYSQFNGLSGEITVNKTNADSAKGEISPITGATITSSAIKDAVNEALSVFDEVSATKEVTANEE